MSRRRAPILILALIPALNLAAALCSTVQAGLVPTWTFSTLAPILSTPKMADLDGDGIQEIVVTTYGQGGNPYGSGWVHVLRPDGSERPGWPYLVQGSPIPATPALGDIENDGLTEIVVGSWSQLYVFKPDGTIAPGFPVSLGASESAALYDVNGDGMLEILYVSSNRIYLLDHTGSVLPGWPYSIDPAYYISSPAVGEIDGDGQVEIIAGSAQGPVDATPFRVYAWKINGTLIPGWPFTTSGVVKVSPALADMDLDGDLEIAVAAFDVSNNDYLYLLRGNGTLMPGWPQRAGGIRLSTPALADLDGNGHLEIIVGGFNPTSFQGQISAFRTDGSVPSGFPIALSEGGQVNDSPIALDLDGDPSRLEILVKNHNYYYGYHSDGSPMANFPYYLSDQSHSGTFSPGPLAGDADGDGDAELVLASCYDAVCYFDSFGPWNPSLAYWPTYKHDAWNTGNITSGPTTGIFDHGRWSEAATSLFCLPNPFREQTSFVLQNGFPNREVVLDLYDALGRRVRNWRLGSDVSGGAAVRWDGCDEAGAPLPAGAYFARQRHLGTAVRVVLLK